MNDPSVQEEPRISVMIPCFEDAAYVERCVGSIREPEPVEIIVIDDCSQDQDTLDALERLAGAGVTVLRNGVNSGVSATRNAGLAAASGRFIFTLDSDDLAVPGRISAMADRLDSDPEAAVCYGDFLEFGTHLLLRATPERVDPYRLAFVNEYPQTALFRKDVVERLGGWSRISDQLDARSDWGLWMSLAESGERGIHFGPKQPTYLYRIGDPRLAMKGRKYHPQTYEQLKRMHPKLFADVADHRRRSDLGWLRGRLYPLLYGRRAFRPWEAEPRVKKVLDDLGIWTLQHPMTDDERRSFQRLVASSDAPVTG